MNALVPSLALCIELDYSQNQGEERSTYNCALTESSVFVEPQKDASGSQKLERYASVLVMSPSHREDSNFISALKLNDSKYSSRTEGDPGTLAHRTFLQACPCSFL